ncbi:CTP synthase [Candidatus Microgenomates bacterium]|nr:MAG: CTP synthase [Candidatus Microgenomates bacterium]
MPAQKTVYIFVSGGVLSGLGKGVTAASLALLLQSRGYTITPVKCENYLNVDSGLINPIEHGDPFLCEDGTEADMDMGTYEKFLHKNVMRHNFITMGQIYQEVISRERNFEYAGEDVEALPHVTDEIIRRIKDAGKKEKADIVVIELGGTAGEYQNVLYYEASRIMKIVHKETVIHVHVSYLPTPSHLGEPKTKPTQLSVKVLQSMGIQPDFIVCRAEKAIDKRRRERLAMFCNVEADNVINNPNVTSVYQVPLTFEMQQFGEKVLALAGLTDKKADLRAWEELNEKINRSHKKTLEIAIVGKYFATGDYELRDSYAALLDALDHAGWAKELTIKPRFINAERIEKGEAVAKLVSGCCGIIVPIGWGPRGVEGKIAAVQYARENKIPYLGLCYGMQLAAVEFARHVLNLPKAHTVECDPKTPDPVIHLIPTQKEKMERRAYGGTMRLGSWECKVGENTRAFEIYNSAHYFKKDHVVPERHRHRYEFNDDYTKEVEKKGLVISGRSVVENLAEIIELPNDAHPFFMGTQFHPEYKSRPLHPHPIFIAFLTACSQYAA